MPILVISLILFASALISGALVPFQAVANAALGKTLEHPLWAAFFSLLVSLAVVSLALLITRSTPPQLNALPHVPVWAWLGGVVGVIYISCAIILTPRMGASGFIVCVIAGQMLAALLIDYFGLMGMPAREIGTARLVGVLSVLAGVLLTQLPAMKA